MIPMVTIEWFVFFTGCSKEQKFLRTGEVAWISRTDLVLDLTSRTQDGNTQCILLISLDFQTYVIGFSQSRFREGAYDFSRQIRWSLKQVFFPSLLFGWRIFLFLGRWNLRYITLIKEWTPLMLSASFVGTWSQVWNHPNCELLLNTVHVLVLSA